MITPSFGLTATERVLPSMALDFTTESLDSRVTFTRSGGTATVVNSNGYVAAAGVDVPRFDYDPVTLACKGLLIEESRTNICLSSETFNSGWMTSNVTVGANVVNSPDGTQNADSLTDNGTSAGHGVRRVFTIAASTQYAASCYVKAGTHNYVQLLPMDGGATDRFAAAVFDVSSSSTETAATETLASTGVTIQSTKQEAAGNGWFRVSMVFTSGSNWATSTTSNRVYMAESATGNTFGTTGASTYAGTGTTLYVWGAQLEAGAFPTSYIPTTTAQVTRTADVATMTGPDFSDWYNQTEGTFQTYWKLFATGTTACYAWTAYQAASSTNRHYVMAQEALPYKPYYVMRPNNSVTAALGPGTAEAESSIVAAYKTDSFALAQLGGTPFTDTSGAVTANIDSFAIGRRQDGSLYLNGHLKTIEYWPYRLTDSQVQAFSK